MLGLLFRALGVAVCAVAATLIYLEAGAADPPLVMPKAERVAPPPPPPTPRAGLRATRFFFGGGPRDSRVEGVLRGVSLDRTIPLGIPRGALTADGPDIRFAFVAPHGDLIGFAIVAPPAALRWEWMLDGAPWPAEAVFAGPYGLPAPELVNGMGASCAHGFGLGAGTHAGTPYFSAAKAGAFVICEDR
ncbi:MAG: hypothetical protein ACLQVI_14485 [Polyangiaceae bacterium]|jgi:hypothetical protein